MRIRKAILTKNQVNMTLLKNVSPETIREMARKNFVSSVNAMAIKKKV
jgi:hypothetical protein